jgi:DNA-binding IclR family transcriptional regulator
MKDDVGGMSSVDRALQILELLGERKSLRVVDVAEQLGVARSTAHRLLAALRLRDFVVQDAGRVYHRGPAFIAAGFGTDRVPAVRAASRPHLERLCERTQETCHLVVLEGNGARFVDGVEAAQILRVGSRTGMLLPAHSTAAGKVLLAELAPAAFAALYPQGLPGMSGELTRRGTLRNELGRIRNRGYATNFGESERGVSAAAVSIRRPDGRAIASIAVACPTTRCPRSRIDTLVAELRGAATAAEETIGERTEDSV